MKLPLLTGDELIRGSHVYLKHADGRATVVPIHSNVEIGRGLLKRILNEIEITREEFEKYL